MRRGEAVFVDSGAWIALALSRDSLHRDALDRNANRDVALTWKEAVYKPGTVKIIPCELRDLEQSWSYFRRADLHKLSAVDATSFAIMRRVGVRIACSFDHRFAMAGFRLVA